MRDQRTRVVSKIFLLWKAVNDYRRLFEPQTLRQRNVGTHRSRHETERLYVYHYIGHASEWKLAIVSQFPVCGVLNTQLIRLQNPCYYMSLQWVVRGKLRPRKVSCAHQVGARDMKHWGSHRRAETSVGAFSWTRRRDVIKTREGELEPSTPPARRVSSCGVDGNSCVHH